MPSNRAALFLLLPLLTAVGFAVSPEVLVYRDGNRVTGRLIEHRSGKIIFASDHFGKLTVDDSEAECLAATQSRVDVAATADALAAPAMPPTASRETAVAPQSKPHFLGAFSRYLRPWTGRASLALEFKKDGNSRGNILTEANIKRLFTRDEIRLSGRFEYTKEEGRITTNITKTDAYWRHDFTRFGQTWFTLYDPEFELNQNYYVENLKLTYFLSKHPLGLGLTLRDRPGSKLRVGVAENFIDLWFWVANERYHGRTNIESLFVEFEQELPYDITVTERGTWFYGISNGDTGYENQFEVSKKLSPALSLGLRHEVRENIPGTNVRFFSLWRVLLGIDF